MTAQTLAGRAAGVTGGGRGVGLATVRRFLAEGASVLIGDFNADVATAAVEALRAEGAGKRVAFLRVDVASEADVEALMQDAFARFGSLDIAFNNAGIGGAIGPLVETQVDHWDTTFAVLTRGVFLGVKHAARIMMNRGGGTIINTASIAGVSAGVLPTAYSAAKAAVVSFTENAANEQIGR